jgi:hypothetical protein
MRLDEIYLRLTEGLARRRIVADQQDNRSVSAVSWILFILSQKL